ncbi:hypothetical protein L7F22_022479 [Adiantum nelumboides]|nr:hypothetical protein [Adiantum nelumboides]
MLKRRSLSLGLVLLICICASDAWSGPWKCSKQSAAVGRDCPETAELRHGAVFELESFGGPAEKEGLSKTFLMKQAHSKALTSPEATCWEKAYRKLLSSCSAILQDEEKKCRLAFEFTDCFLRMTGWPPPPLCPDSSLVRLCTEKFDIHTHKVYLAFFVETAAMCHHLQGEAFRKEARDVVNELKQTGYQVLNKVKEVKGLSDDIINDALQQSQLLTEKLTGIETLSQSLLAHEQHVQTQLKSVLDSVQAVYNVSDNLKTQQKDIQQLHEDMHQTISSDMQELRKAALRTNQQLLNTLEGYRQLADQQVQLVDSVVNNVQQLKDSALQSLNELKDSQTFTMQETRASFQDLTEGAQNAQASLYALRTKMDATNDMLLQSSRAILQAQETFVAKQGSMLSTLERIFSLYDSTLYESRALKMLIFYGMSLLFVHVLTSAKQTNNARAKLYSGLFISIVLELLIMKAYDTLLQNQQWMQVCSYWIRAIFGILTGTHILYCMATYRDLSLQNHELLLRLQRKLSDLANQHVEAPYFMNNGDKGAEPHKDDSYSGHFSLFTATAKSLIQSIALKTLHPVHKFVWRHRGKRKSFKNDSLKDWIEGHGLDASTLQPTDDSSFDDDDEDPDYQCSEPFMNKVAYKNYNLRSSCSQSCKHKIGFGNSKRKRILVLRSPSESAVNPAAVYCSSADVCSGYTGCGQRNTSGRRSRRAAQIELAARVHAQTAGIKLQCSSDGRAQQGQGTGLHSRAAQHVSVVCVISVQGDSNKELTLEQRGRLMEKNRMLRIVQPCLLLRQEYVAALEVSKEAIWLARLVLDLERCLANKDVSKPSIEDVLWNLKYALQLQENCSDCCTLVLWLTAALAISLSLYLVGLGLPEVVTIMESPPLNIFPNLRSPSSPPSPRLSSWSQQQQAVELLQSLNYGWRRHSIFPSTFIKLIAL